jgi:hypothetical protein
MTLPKQVNDFKQHTGTSEIGIYPLPLGNRTVILVDTPGFDGTYQSALKILQEIIFFLSSIHSSKFVKLAGIIYMQRITDLGMRSSAVGYKNILEALCGKSALSHLVLATTMWDVGDHWGIRERREKLLWNRYWRAAVKSGAVMLRHDNTKSSALRILDHILSFQGGIVLEIQREMIDQPKTLDQTFVGQRLVDDLLEREAKLEDELLQLRKKEESVDFKFWRDLAAIVRRRSYLTESVARLKEQRMSISSIDFPRLRKEWETRYQEMMNRGLKLYKIHSNEVGQQLLRIENEMQISVESSRLNKTGSEGGESEARKDTQYTPALDMGMITSKTGSSLPEITPFSIGLSSSQVAVFAGVADLTLGLAKAREGSERSRVPLSIADNARERPSLDGKTSNQRVHPSTSSGDSHEDGSPISRLSHETSSKLDTESRQPSEFLSEGGSKKVVDLETVRSNSAGSGSSSKSGFMTDSTIVEDLTDWEEDSDGDNYVHQVECDYSALVQRDVEYQSLIGDSLEPVKREMVDRLMEEFWIIFHQKLFTDFRKCPSNPGDSASTSRSTFGFEFGQGSLAGGNPGGGQNGDERDDENFGNDPKDGPGGKGTQPEFPPNTDQTPAVFACPYRKHNPRKYCVRDWRTCALTPHKTVARVK